MVRLLTSPSTWEAGKWLAWTLFLVLPGSLVVLAVWWFSTARTTASAGWHERGEDRYLSEATDLPDLERRMRVLERGTGGPVFVTFNH